MDDEGTLLFLFSHGSIYDSDDDDDGLFSLLTKCSRISFGFALPLSMFPFFSPFELEKD